MPATPTAPIRPATTRDDVEVAATLSRAFHDDPVIAWLVPDEGSRHRRQQIFYRAELDHAHANGLVLTTDDQAGAALWLAPKRWRIDTPTMVRQTPAIVRTFGRRIPAALKLNTAMEHAHPSEPHWYLSILGTDPDHQGSGIGGALILGVTDRCDINGVGAYLESSKPDNVPYYERFGFAVTGEIAVADSPTLYAMWRDPR